MKRSLMPRKRTKSSNKLPPYVTKSKGRYVWRQYLGRKDGRTLYAPEIVLCRDHESVATVWDLYNIAAKDGPTIGTIEWLLDRFIASSKFKKLAERTQSDYLKYRDIIVNRKSRNGRFGDATLTSITVRTINGYLSSGTSDVQSNRQMAMLSSAWNWIAGEENIPTNPIPGCRWNTETPRTRYVEDWEYNAVYAFAGPSLQVAMELAYLCRLRKCEVIALETLQDLKPNGILARRRKGSRHQIVEMSERLEKAIAAAKALHGNVTRFTLVVTRKQTAYTINGLPGVLRTACIKAVEAGALTKPFTMHDLKRKGVSDFEGTATEKLDSAGHRDRRTAEIYDVKPGLTRSTR